MKKKFAKRKNFDSPLFSLFLQSTLHVYGLVELKLHYLHCLILLPENLSLHCFKSSTSPA
jgi:hypothetical protein